MKLLITFLVLLGCLLANTAFAREEFSLWLDALKQEAISVGITEQTATDTISRVQLLPNIIKLDRSQPEFISPFLDYYQRRVDALKIKRGREMLANHAILLNQVEMQYGVPKEILVAFWGMETNYGRFQGNIDMLSALATLAYDGRRSSFFRNQLMDAMRMIDADHADAEELVGSWAGAFGNMQFMPTTFMTYAVDGDGDNKIDVVNSTADAFASAANYLSQVGWRKGEPAM
ncbi:MAG: lytic murein transglycosylase, partial [Methylotenera sp.]|nr:lytic murein transglycosylase [Methylotenera sp.]